MIQKGLYLRIVEGGQLFLLPSDEVMTIERHERMQASPENASSGVVGWFLQGADRSPAVRLGQILGLNGGADWGHAVFFRTTSQSLGVAAEQVQLLPQHQDVRVRGLNVIGNALPGGSPFMGVWVNGDVPALVLDSRRLVGQILRQTSDA